MNLNILKKNDKLKENEEVYIIVKGCAQFKIDE